MRVMASDGFADLARSLSEFVDAGERRPPQTFAANSPAANECTAEHMADEWGDMPNQEAWFFVGLASGAGWDHLRALEELLRGGKVTLSLSTVARGAVEAFSLAYFVGNPNIDSRERVRRYMNLQLQSLQDQRPLLTVSADGEMSEAQRKDQARAEQAHSDQSRGIIASAGRQKFKVYDEKDRIRPTHLEAKVPSKTQLAEEVIGSGTSKLGSVIYGSLSGAAHSAIHTLSQSLVEDLASGSKNVRLGIHEQDAATRLFGGPLAAMTVLSAVYPQLGWATPQDAIDTVGFTWMRVGRVQPPDEVVIPEAFRRPGWGHQGST